MVHIYETHQCLLQTGYWWKNVWEELLKNLFDDTIIQFFTRKEHTTEVGGDEDTLD